MILAHFLNYRFFRVARIHKWTKVKIYSRIVTFIVIPVVFLWCVDF